VSCESRGRNKEVRSQNVYESFSGSHSLATPTGRAIARVKQ